MGDARTSSDNEQKRRHIERPAIQSELTIVVVGKASHRSRRERLDSKFEERIAVRNQVSSGVADTSNWRRSCDPSWGVSRPRPFYFRGPYALRSGSWPPAIFWGRGVFFGFAPPFLPLGARRLRLSVDRRRQFVMVHAVSNPVTNHEPAIRDAWDGGSHDGPP